VQDLVDRARALDEGDPLASFLERFAVDDRIYLDGNSLGRMPRTTADRISEVLGEWAEDAVIGWERWIDLGVEIGNELAPLIGASPGEVAVGDQTSVNLFKLASAALEASDGPDILSDEGNFPSDLHVLEHVANRAGGDLILLPEDPTSDAIASAINGSIGLASFSHVSYRSGRLFDAESVTAAAHRSGAMVLWDLSHSVGALPIGLDAWTVDLAVGCTYKYLNGGPGSPAFLFVREDLHTRLDQPIHGWFGHEDQFGFATAFSPSPSIRRFLVGTPSVIAMAATREGIRLTAEAGIEATRAKAVALTSLFIEAIDRSGHADDIEVVTPRDPTQRGAHVAIRHPAALEVSRALRRRDVIPDFRSPDIIRFGFAPLTTTFRDVVGAAMILDSTLDDGFEVTERPSHLGVT